MTSNSLYCLKDELIMHSFLRFSTPSFPDKLNFFLIPGLSVPIQPTRPSSDQSDSSSRVGYKAFTPFLIIGTSHLPSGCTYDLLYNTLPIPHPT